MLIQIKASRGFFSHYRDADGRPGADGLQSIFSAAVAGVLDRAGLAGEIKIPDDPAVFVDAAPTGDPAADAAAAAAIDAGRSAVQAAAVEVVRANYDNYGS